METSEYRATLELLQKNMVSSERLNLLIDHIESLNARLDDIENFLGIHTDLYSEKSMKKNAVKVPNHIKRLLEKYSRCLERRENDMFDLIYEDCVRLHYPITKKKIREYYFETYKEREDLQNE